MRSEAEVAAMACPVCRVPLAMSDRQGIEIDYCPQCRGVWLDRGELDKIIERSVQPAPAAAPPPPPPPQQSAQQQQSYSASPWPSDNRGGYSQHGKPYKKKKSWLDDIFD
jgi:Zn-finger nucleic acid-binding protein